MFWLSITFLLFLITFLFIPLKITSSNVTGGKNENDSHTVPINSHLCHAFLWHFYVLFVFLSYIVLSREVIMSFSWICVVLDCTPHVEEKFNNKYKQIVLRGAFSGDTRANCSKAGIMKPESQSLICREIKRIALESVPYRCYHQAVKKQKSPKKSSETVCDKVAKQQVESHISTSSTALFT